MRFSTIGIGRAWDACGYIFLPCRMRSLYLKTNENKLDSQYWYSNGCNYSITNPHEISPVVLKLCNFDVQIAFGCLAKTIKIVLICFSNGCWRLYGSESWLGPSWQGLEIVSIKRNRNVIINITLYSVQGNTLNHFQSISTMPVNIDEYRHRTVISKTWINLDIWSNSN